MVPRTQSMYLSRWIYVVYTAFCRIYGLNCQWQVSLIFCIWCINWFPWVYDHKHCWIFHVCLYSVIIFSQLFSLYHYIIALLCQRSRIHLWNYDEGFILFIFCSSDETGCNLFRKGPVWKFCSYWENSSIIIAFHSMWPLNFPDDKILVLFWHNI